jgi:hypothetical protein
VSASHVLEPGVFPCWDSHLAPLRFMRCALSRISISSRKLDLELRAIVSLILYFLVRLQQRLAFCVREMRPVGLGSCYQHRQSTVSGWNGVLLTSESVSRSIGPRRFPCVAGCATSPEGSRIRKKWTPLHPQVELLLLRPFLYIDEIDKRSWSSCCSFRLAFLGIHAGGSCLFLRRLRLVRNALVLHRRPWRLLHTRAFPSIF